MPWFPVDDAFHSHPKARKAGFEAIGLWTVAGSFCMAYLTDGFVPGWFVKERGARGLVLAKRLVSAELWKVGDRDGEEGWWFHDWKPECTKAHVLEVRKKARQRKAKSRESHEQSQDVSRVTTDEPDAGVLGINQPKPTQTNNPLVDLGGGVAQVAARDTPPRPKCPDHEENSDGPCIPCKRRREWDENHATRLKADEAARARSDELDSRRRRQQARAQAIADCPLCDDEGLIDIGEDLAQKCEHHG